MKFEFLLNMLFDLLQNRRLTARFFTQKYALSARTVYRYLDVLTKFLPLTVTRGRNGGVTLADCYKLPVDFLNEQEYEATMYALRLAYAQNPSLIFLNAKDKISAVKKVDLDDSYE